MKAKYLLIPALLVVAVPLGGCDTTPVQTAYGTMPAYCTQNNAAEGAAVGSLLGAALGGALGGWQGAAIGAGSGALFGGLTGTQADAQCRQIALNNMMTNMAAAQLPNAPPAPYQSIEYTTPSDNVRHQITPTNSYTDPATKAKCATFLDVSFDKNNNAAPSQTRHACKGADGNAHEG